jgi:hypothetical protein
LVLDFFIAFLGRFVTHKTQGEFKNTTTTKRFEKAHVRGLSFHVVAAAAVVTPG